MSDTEIARAVEGSDRGKEEVKVEGAEEELKVDLSCACSLSSAPLPCFFASVSVVSLSLQLPPGRGAAACV
eukprot:901362-Rhodomonas_salina.1